ncbi:MAG: riboflavin biosynthesis protein RibD [Acidiferrobacteraceae bacterium]|nr:riboflavin biosynthesis protein RibD [Acidiferrobacteraceae bacterium]|tara:strand:+ start:5344 stop:6444 length:1101 start_codon:yes stop_codon:yes gene_type:complete
MNSHDFLDVKMMERALKLAERGSYTTKPNPKVGAVICHDENIIAEGWHRHAGQPHAEINALKSAGDKAEGATLYVNLEPCVHKGRTGPCVTALMDSGIRRVVIAMEDPNPDVAGKGIAALRDAGIQLSIGIGFDQAKELNEGFIKRMLTGMPFVRLKMAATIDGRTAAPDGSSKWITSAESRTDVHHWRANSSAIIAGIGTILADDPLLNARIDEDVVQPIRVILDSDARIKPDASLFTENGEILLVNSASKQLDQISFGEQTETICLPGENDQVDLESIVKELGTRQCNDVLIESGATLAGSFANTNLVDEYLIYLSPDILGSKSSGMFYLPRIDNIADRIELSIKEITHFGRDIRLRLRPENPI